MSDDYQKILDAVDQHLQSLKAGGTRFVAVDAETLAELNQPVAPRQIFVAPTAAPKTDSHAAAKVFTAPPENFAAPKIAAPLPSLTSPSAASVGAESKEAAMADLRARAMACQKCPNLASSRKNVVFGVGNIHSPLMFVGEAPGADEDEQGEPFVGKAGQLLTKIIQTMGYSRQSIYIANILKCRPDTPGQAYGNRKPTTDEMKTCLPYLLAQIDLIQPRVIVALGATAVEGLFGKTTLGITKQRGTWMSFRDTPVMPTYHPAYLLRNQALSEKRRVWEDMLQVLEKLGAPISEKQRGYFLSKVGE